MVVLSDIIVGSCLVVKTYSYTGLYGDHGAEAKVAVSFRTCTSVFSLDGWVMLALVTGSGKNRSIVKSETCSKSYSYTPSGLNLLNHYAVLEESKSLP